MDRYINKQIQVSTLASLFPLPIPIYLISPCTPLKKVDTHYRPEEDLDKLDIKHISFSIEKIDKLMDYEYLVSCQSEPKVATCHQ